MNERLEQQDQSMEEVQQAWNVISKFLGKHKVLTFFVENEDQWGRDVYCLTRLNDQGDKVYVLQGDQSCEYDYRGKACFQGR